MLMEPTVSIISNYTPRKYDNTRFTTVPLKPGIYWYFFLVLRVFKFDNSFIFAAVEMGKSVCVEELQLRIISFQN